jgi:hypothetical protein
LPLKCLGVPEQNVLSLVERASCVPDLDVVALDQRAPWTIVLDCTLPHFLGGTLSPWDGATPFLGTDNSPSFIVILTQWATLFSLGIVFVVTATLSFSSFWTAIGGMVEIGHRTAEMGHRTAVGRTAVSRIGYRIAVERKAWL